MKSLLAVLAVGLTLGAQTAEIYTTTAAERAQLITAYTDYQSAFKAWESTRKEIARKHDIDGDVDFNEDFSAFVLVQNRFMMHGIPAPGITWPQYIGPVTVPVNGLTVR